MNFDKQKTTKCPYCDFSAIDKDEIKIHLINFHKQEVLDLANKHNQTLSWAAGEIAAYSNEV